MAYSVRDKILSVLAHTSCHSDYLHKSFKHHYHKDSIYKALRSLKSNNYIDHVGSGHINLTDKGNKLIENKVPVFNNVNKTWDGYWRLFLFDVPEIKRHRRDYLRKKLKSFGFGLWQRSVWITPFNIEDRLSEVFGKNPHYSVHVEVLKGKRV